MTTPRSDAVHRFGRGPRQALALHCTFGHGQAWRGIGQAFGDTFALVAPDMPSHGKAQDWDGHGCYLLACADAVAPVADAPVDLIGHSFGAVVALHLALAGTIRIRSLCLIEPVLFAAARTDPSGAFDRFEAEERSYCAPLEAGDLETAGRVFTAMWGDGRDWSDIPEKTRRYVTDRMHLISAQKDALHQDSAGLLAAGRLESLDFPVLLIRGSESPEITAVIQRTLAMRLRNPRDVVISGAGHMAPVTHPDKTAAAIAGFVRSD